MEQKQDYTWRELIRDSEQIECWQPFMVPDPYKMPGFEPKAAPPYGTGKISASYEWHNPERPEYSLDRIGVKMYIGEAALWQMYIDDGLSRAAEEKRLASNMSLLKFLEPDFSNPVPRHQLRVLPYQKPVGPDGLVPFTIYSRKKKLDDVIAVQIDHKIHYSTDERLIDKKRKALWNIDFHAATGMESHQIIAEAIKEQMRQLQK